MRPDGEPSLFLFRFYEAAVRDLTHPAINGPSRRARKSRLGVPSTGRFPATSLDLFMARPGHKESLATGGFLVSLYVDLVSGQHGAATRK
jgi:hypothetical protein